MSGDPYFDKVVLLLDGSDFEDKSYYKNKVVPVGTGTSVTSGHLVGNTQVGKAILTGTTSNANSVVNSVYVMGQELQDLGSEFTIEMSVYLTGWNSVFSTLLGCGLRDVSISYMNSWDVPISVNGLGFESLRGSVNNSASMALNNSIPLNTWVAITIIKDSAGMRAYAGQTQIGTNQTGLNGVPISCSYNRGLSLLASATVGNNNFGGLPGYIGGLRITKAARPAPNSATLPYFDLYAGQLIGNIVETTSITDWVVLGYDPKTGKTCRCDTNTDTFVLNCPTRNPHNITLMPRVDLFWSPLASVKLGDYVVPSNTDANPVLYKCTACQVGEVGALGATEPDFTASSHTSGSVTLTKVADLTDPVTLMAKIPS
jgi:hypothetical protein